MLNIGNEKVPVCSGLTRRSFLQLGTAGLAGMWLRNWKRCIVRVDGGTISTRHDGFKLFSVLDFTDVRV